MTHNPQLVEHIITTYGNRVISDEEGTELRRQFAELDNVDRIHTNSVLKNGGIDRLAEIKSFHPFISDLVLDVFKIPVGDAGIGVVPDVTAGYGTNEAYDDEFERRYGVRPTGTVRPL